MTHPAGSSSLDFVDGTLSAPERAEVDRPPARRARAAGRGARPPTAARAALRGLADAGRALGDRFTGAVAEARARAARGARRGRPGGPVPSPSLRSWRSSRSFPRPRHLLRRCADETPAAGDGRGRRRRRAPGREPPRRRRLQVIRRRVRCRHSTSAGGRRDASGRGGGARTPRRSAPPATRSSALRRIADGRRERRLPPAGLPRLPRRPRSVLIGAASRKARVTSVVVEAGRSRRGARHRVDVGRCDRGLHGRCRSHPRVSCLSFRRHPTGMDGNRRGVAACGRIPDA